MNIPISFLMRLIELFSRDFLSFIISVAIPTVAAIVVFIYQRIKHNEENFIRITSDLHSDNHINQITSAILLRTFLSMRHYRKKALNVIVALLRVLPSGNLQKTLADGLTYMGKALGQDFQKVNLHGVLIKPQSYVNYELYNKPDYLLDRLSLCGADFFENSLVWIHVMWYNISQLYF